MSNLLNYQYEIEFRGKAYKFGRSTPVTVEQLDLGDAEVEIADGKFPRGDGSTFGRDYKGGRTLTWQGNILGRGPTQQADVINALNDLETMWDAEEVRLEPEEVTVLRMKRGGRQLRVYGRPRRFTPVTGRTHQGWIPYTMDFKTLTRDYYDDGEQYISVGMVPEETGGFPVPFIGGWIANGLGLGREVMEIGGTKPAWLVIKIEGPTSGAIVNPEVEFLGAWKVQLKGEIRYDQFVVIDGTPWSRGIRRNDGANWSGKITTVSQRTSNLRLNPGPYTVVIRGTDSTMTSRVTVYWRDTYGSHTAIGGGPSLYENAVRTGVGPPTGNEGEFYIDQTTGDLYEDVT